VVGAIPEADFEPEVPESIFADASPEEQQAIRAHWLTQTEARAFNLTIPPPRGQIVDRRGRPMAQNKVVHYLALSFPHFGDDVSHSQIVEFGRRQIGLANRALNKEWSMDDDKLIQHYENRRWLPLVFSTEAGIHQDLDERELELIDPLLGRGLILHPTYLRTYPLGEFAPHVLGYTGKVRPLPVTPVQDGDPLFEETEGRQGLELSFNRFLEGQPGIVNVIFDPNGVKLKEELIRPPRPGHCRCHRLHQGRRQP
jgi:penicillin-binding protein 2